MLVFPAASRVLLSMAVLFRLLVSLDPPPPVRTVHSLAAQCTVWLHSVQLCCTVHSSAAQCIVGLHSAQLVCTVYSWAVQCTVGRHSAQINMTRKTRSSILNLCAINTLHGADHVVPSTLYTVPTMLCHQHFTRLKPCCAINTLQSCEAYTQVNHEEIS